MSKNILLLTPQLAFEYAPQVRANAEALREAGRVLAGLFFYGPAATFWVPKTA